MSLVQVNEDLLLDFIETLKKVAPLGRPRNEEEHERIKHWAQIASFVREISEPMSHHRGFDAENAYWAELAHSYAQEARDYDAQHGGSAAD